MSLRRYALQGMSFTNIYITKGVYMAVIIGEAVFYWQYRKRIRASLFAWYHIGGMVMAFFILPSIQTIYPFLLDFTGSSGDGYREAYAIFSKVTMVVFWVFFIVAHIFFAMMIIKGFSNEKEEEKVAGSSPDILSEYADQ
jgi:magnesium-transporting ATPase (P-type)